MEYFLLHFGYAFLVLGLLMEGDATLVAAVFLASRSGPHYFNLRAVLAIALGVTVLGNELLYELGSLGWLSARVGTGKHYRRASRWLHQTRSGYLSLLFSRFMWGFRLMIPVAAGLLHIPRRRFSISNLVGGAIWVGIVAYFGVALQSLILMLHSDLVLYQSHIAVALFLLGLLIGLTTIPWQIVRRGNRRAEREARQFSLGAMLRPSHRSAHPPGEVAAKPSKPTPPAKAPVRTAKPAAPAAESGDRSSAGTLKRPYAH